MPIIGKPLLVLGSIAGVSLVGVGGFIGISALDSQMKEQVDPSSAAQDTVSSSDQGIESAEREGVSDGNPTEERKGSNTEGSGVSQVDGSRGEASRSVGSEGAEGNSQKQVAPPPEPASSSQASGSPQEGTAAKALEGSLSAGEEVTKVGIKSPEATEGVQTQNSQGISGGAVGPITGSTSVAQPSITSPGSEGKTKSEGTSTDLSATRMESSSGTGGDVGSTEDGTSNEKGKATGSSTSTQGENTVPDAESSGGHGAGESGAISS